MKKINLIPDSQKKRLFYKKIIKILDLSFVIILVLIIGFAITLFLVSSYLENKKAILARQLVEFHDKNKHYDDLVGEISFYQKRLEIIKKINPNLDYRFLFEKISSLVPLGCQIERISFSQDVLRISGIASSFKEIAQFEKNLKNENDFLNAKITTASPKEGIINFEIVIEGSSDKK